MSRKSVLIIVWAIGLVSIQPAYASMREYVDAAAQVAADGLHAVYTRIVGVRGTDETPDSPVKDVAFPASWDVRFSQEALQRHDYPTLKAYLDHCLRVLRSSESLAWVNAQAAGGEVLCLYLSVRNFAELVYRGVAIDTTTYQAYLNQLLWFFYRVAYDYVKCYCLFDPLIINEGKYPSLLIKMQGYFGDRVAEFERHLSFSDAKERIAEKVREFDSKPLPSPLASISLYARAGTGGIHCAELDPRLIRSCCLTDRLAFLLQKKMMESVQRLFASITSWEDFFANFQVEEQVWLDEVKDAILRQLEEGVRTE